MRSKKQWHEKFDSFFGGGKGDKKPKMKRLTNNQSVTRTLVMIQPPGLQHLDYRSGPQCKKSS